MKDNSLKGFDDTNIDNDFKPSKKKKVLQKPHFLEQYEEESKKLLKKHYENELKIREKYKGIRYDEYLDGSPEDIEIRKNDKWYSTEMKKLKEKYHQQ